MTSDRWGIAGFIAIYVAVRIVDYILPGGHHFRLADRWAKSDKENDDADT